MMRNHSQDIRQICRQNSEGNLSRSAATCSLQERSKNDTRGKSKTEQKVCKLPQERKRWCPCCKSGNKKKSVFSLAHKSLSFSARQRTECLIIGLAKTSWARSPGVGGPRSPGLCLYLRDIS
eukprot:1157021-Pelagomonas_calceolata.AAC.4